VSKSSSGGSHVSDRAKEERRLGWKLAGPAFVIMVLVTFYPILQAVYSSLFKHRLTDPGGQRFVFLENYLIILRAPLRGVPRGHPAESIPSRPENGPLLPVRNLKLCS